MIYRVEKAKYVRKFLVSVATGLATLYVVLDGGMTPQEWILVALSVLGSIGVYAVKNDPPAP